MALYDHALVQHLIEARISKCPMTLSKARDLMPNNTYDAYLIQQAISQELGWFDSKGPVLWKLGGATGFTTTAALPLSALKIHPSGTPILLSTQDECTFTGVEVELAIELGTTIQPGATLNEIISAIDKTYLAIEVCDQRAESWEKLPNLFRLADHQMNRQIILLDSPISSWDTELNKLAPNIYLGNKLITNSTLTHPQSHPLIGLTWLANLSQALYKQPLRKGSIIATGTWAGLHTLDTQTTFKASTYPFSEVNITLT